MNNPDDFLHLPVDPDEKLSPGTVTFRVLFDALVSSEEFKKSTGIPSLSLSSLKLHQPVEVCARGVVSDIFRVRAQSQESDFSCIFKKFARNDLPELTIYDGFRIFSHNIECRFYELAAAHVARLVPFRVPRPYFIQKIPTEILTDSNAVRERHVFLVLEDLMWPDKRIGNVSMLQGLSRAQAEAAVVALAQFHAASMTLPRVVLDESFNAVDHMDFAHDTEPFFEKIFAIPESSCFQEHRAMLQKMFTEYSGVKNLVHKKFGIPPTLCHGDFWLNNFMFELPESSEAPISKIDSLLDFQCVYAGTGVNDLIRLVFTCVDAELRRTHFHRDWIPLYQRTLAKCLEDHGRPELIVGREVTRIEAELVPFHRGNELIFALVILLYLANKTSEAGERARMIARMVCLFDDIKQQWIE